MNDDSESREESGADIPPRPRPHRGRLLTRFRNYFFTGIVVVAPVGITMWLAWQVITFLDYRVKPLIPEIYNPETYLPFSIPGLGLVATVVVLTVIGALAANYSGRLLVRTGERLVDRMPVVRGVYGALKQIFETVLRQSSGSFRQVVLVEYPRRGIWAIAFITGTTEGEVQNTTEDELVNVFLPTTPNPTSGFLLFVPSRDLVHLGMTVEEGIKMVIWGGIVTPPDRRPAEARAVPRIPTRRDPEEADEAPEPRRVSRSGGT